MYRVENHFPIAKNKVSKSQTCKLLIDWISCRPAPCDNKINTLTFSIRSNTTADLYVFNMSFKLLHHMSRIYPIYTTYFLLSDLLVIPSHQGHQITRSPRSLTLLGREGGTLCPPVAYLRITVQIHVQACWKNLTFPKYDFGKGQCAFYPTKLSEK